jgi:hypothetical protein
MPSEAPHPAPRHDLGRDDLVFEAQQAVLALHAAQEGGALLVAEQAGEGFQRAAERRRGDRRIAPQAEVARLNWLPNHRPKLSCVVRFAASSNR